jgi:ComF family protein
MSNALQPIAATRDDALRCFSFDGDSSMTSPPKVDTTADLRGADRGARQAAILQPIVRGIRYGVRHVITRVGDWLLPPVCLACNVSIAAHHALCGACWREVRFIRAPLCDRLGLPLPFDSGGRQISAAAAAHPPDYDRARAAAHFTGTIRTLIHNLKYHDKHEPRVLLSRWLTAAGEDLLSDAHLIIPVPLNRRRLLWRRFNQSALLAREVSRISGVPMAPLALQRRRHTPPQVGLTEAQRASNVRGAFKVPAAAKALIVGRNILLVEDVITTGATINACARALKRAGAARVDVVALGLMTNEARLLNP